MNNSPWTWTVQKETAARMIAEGDLSERQIAKRVGVNRNTIGHWKKSAEFCARIGEHFEETSEALAEQSLDARKECAELAHGFLEKVSDIVSKITTDELSTIKKNPIAAIGLMIRLQNLVDKLEKQPEPDYDEDEYPFSDLSPEAESEILAIFQRERDRNAAATPNRFSLQ